jgi:hypothetical protein
MNFNWIGPAAALATFTGIWAGHVAVRKIEAAAVSLKIPVLLFALSGLALEAAAFLLSDRLPAAVLGILGITLLWDAFECVRQQKRVIRGHAPANPANPRHAQILARYPTATTKDWLKREPVGQRAAPGEAEGAASGKVERTI